MKVGLAFRGRLRDDLGPVGQEIDLTHQALTAWREIQHGIDGEHTDVTAETMDVAGLTKFGGPWQMPIEAVLTPPYTITSDQNNYDLRNLDRAIVVRITTDATRTFTGIATDKDEFRWLMLVNVGNFSFSLAHNSTSSKAQFRIGTPMGATVTVGSGGSVLLWYDRHAGNWRVVAFAGDVEGVVTTSGGIAPDNAQYITAASNSDLSAERVATNTSSIEWDFATAAQAKADLTDTGVTAGTYGSASEIPQITVDIQGRITSATSVAVSGGSGHLHGIDRVLGDGATTTFNLLDVAEYLMLVSVNGAIADPATHTLSTNRDQIVFDTAPGSGQVVVISYVVANL